MGPYTYCCGGNTPQLGVNNFILSVSIASRLTYARATLDQRPLVHARAFVLSDQAKKAQSIRFSVQQASLTPGYGLREACGSENLMLGAFLAGFGKTNAPAPTVAGLVWPRQ